MVFPLILIAMDAPLPPSGSSSTAKSSSEPSSTRSRIPEKLFSASYFINCFFCSSVPEITVIFFPFLSRQQAHTPVTWQNSSCKYCNSSSCINPNIFSTCTQYLLFPLTGNPRQCVHCSIFLQIDTIFYAFFYKNSTYSLLLSSIHPCFPPVSPILRQFFTGLYPPFFCSPSLIFTGILSRTQGIPAVPKKS